MKNNFVIQLNRKKEEAFVTVIINNNYDKQIKMFKALKDSIKKLNDTIEISKRVCNEQ